MNKDIRLSVVDVENRYSDDYVESVYGGGIVSYGEDNSAPSLYRNCYRNSATLKSVIDGTVNYILGDSVDVYNKKFEKVNRSGMTMRGMISSIALDYELYGGFAIQVIYSKLGTVAELYPLDFSRCRVNESGSKVYYSKKNWTRYGTKSEEFDRFNPEKFDVKKPTQIYWYKGDNTKTVYPMPQFFGAINDILTEIECTKYGLNSVANGFSAKYIINIPESANATDEEKEAIEQAIRNKFCGAETESNFMLYWMDGSTNKMEISKIESDDAPEKFVNIRNNARANIFTSMRATPNLFGLPTETTGFNSQEYSDSFKLYQKTVIQPIQSIIQEQIGNIIGEGAIKINEFKISFE